VVGCRFRAVLSQHSSPSGPASGAGGRGGGQGPKSS
jgi:hypothetical protein